MRNCLLFICALCINISYATVVCHEAQPSGQVCISDDPNDPTAIAGAGPLPDTRQNSHLANPNDATKSVETSIRIDEESEK